ncbi:MAG: hypothetical protein QMD53_05815 [Actinomycetota bacterium]|nr:hypothetical protein [Actinomycetota bacterium]
MLKNEQGSAQGGAADVTAPADGLGGDLAQERLATISLIEVLASRLSQIEGRPVALIELTGPPEHSDGRCLYEGEVILHIRH